MKYAAWSIGILFTDRALKYYAQNLPTGKVFSFGLFEFGHFLNPSLFFFPAWRFIPWLALAVLVALIAVLLSRIGTKHLTPNTWSLIPIVLGGASNVFDRFAYGGVLDYVEILGIATVNLADILILGGLILLIFKPKP